jgi:hypothetical protein
MTGDVESISASEQPPSRQRLEGRRQALEKVLVLPVYLLALFAALHWASVAQIMNGSRPTLWCGNVISDPLSILMNKLIPLAAVCVATISWQRHAARRRPLLPIAIVPLLLGTVVALMLETNWLHDEFDLPTAPVWWFPWN